MTPMQLPSVFVSHGSPMIALEPGDAGAFMARLGPAIDAAFGRPRAIVSVSAHAAATKPIVLAGPRHSAIHDFGAFDPELFTLRYDAPGDPALARRVLALLQGAAIDACRVDEGGLDHGAWTALRYIYPAADIPVVPLAWVASDSPARQFAVGAALAPLAGEGVLVLASGSITHNLRRAFARGLHPPRGVPEIPEGTAFRRWFAERSAQRDWPALFDYRRLAPYAVDMHPTDEHLLPWYVAAGAGGCADAPQRLHDGVEMGCIGMDAYAFGSEAAALSEALGVAEPA